MQFARSGRFKELTVQGADRSRALKGLTHHKLAPGAELTVQGTDDFTQLSYYSALPEQTDFSQSFFETPRPGIEPGSPGSQPRAPTDWVVNTIYR